MAIYTKKGDGGETSSLTGSTSKNSLLIRAIGAIDEVNSFLGMVGGLTQIQRNLFITGAVLAGAKLRFPKTKTKTIEREIDRLEGSLPVIKNFILPGGTETGAKLYFARALVRRAERAVVALSRKEKVPPQILIYLNRLSDFFFMKAREANLRAGVKEEVWKGRAR